MNAVVILQARTTSTRLPGKALLPVAGYPSAVLAALRAGNRGANVLAATSSDTSDDALAEVFCRHRIPLFRGPLHDVLARYHAATADLSPEAVVVRLTADNMLPDGDLVRELTSAFENSGLDYLGTSDRLPYGVAAEAFSVKALRKAHHAATTAYDREHVGPWMLRNCESGTYTPPAFATGDHSHLRCTLDYEQDYLRILRLFDGSRDPMRMGWYELTQKLSSLPD